MLYLFLLYREMYITMENISSMLCFQKIFLLLVDLGIPGFTDLPFILFCFLLFFSMKHTVETCVAQVSVLAFSYFQKWHSSLPPVLGTLGFVCVSSSWGFSSCFYTFFFHWVKVPYRQLEEKKCLRKVKVKCSCLCFKATLYPTWRKQVLPVGGDYLHKRLVLFCPELLKSMVRSGHVDLDTVIVTITSLFFHLFVFLVVTGVVLFQLVSVLGNFFFLWKVHLI